MQNTSHAVMAQRHEAADSPDDFPTPPWATRALIGPIGDQDTEIWGMDPRFLSDVPVSLEGRLALVNPRDTFALMSAMFWVVVGSTVTLAVGTVNTLIGIGLSVLVYGVINDVASRYANRSGTSVALFSRAVFGQIGAAFAAGLFGLTITYYAVAEGSIVAIALHQYFGTFPMAVWYLIVVLYQAPLVFRGVRAWLDKINGALLPFYVLGLVGSVIWAVVEVGYSNAWLSFEPLGGPVPGGDQHDAPAAVDPALEVAEDARGVAPVRLRRLHPEVQRVPCLFQGGRPP
jgi:hypothetical protein